MNQTNLLTKSHFFLQNINKLLIIPEPNSPLKNYTISSLAIVSWRDHPKILFNWEFSLKVQNVLKAHEIVCPSCLLHLKNLSEF